MYNFNELEDTYNLLNEYNEELAAYTLSPYAKETDYANQRRLEKLFTPTTTRQRIASQRQQDIFNGPKPLSKRQVRLAAKRKVAALQPSLF